MRARIGWLVVLVPVAAVAALPPLAEPVLRNPFRRPPTSVEATVATSVDLSLRGVSQTPGRVLALLEGSDGVGRVVEAGSILPDLQVRVADVGPDSVRLVGLEDDTEWIVRRQQGNAVAGRDAR